jgi:phage/plasmid-associated DNA primase
VKQEVYDATLTFIKRILPDPNLLNWYIRRLNRAFAKDVEKLVILPYNQVGNNGKTKFFQLIGKALGDFYTSVNTKLLSDTSSNATANNEELMSLKDKLVAFFSEPDEGKAMNIGLLKLLSGEDDISGSRKYKGKETFVATGLNNIACNFLPPLGGVGKAVFNRVRCVPFESEFTDDKNRWNDEENIYPLDTQISSKFDEWKFALMKIVFEYTDRKEYDDTPSKVLEHTAQYREREDWLKTFFDENVVLVKDEKMGTTPLEMYDKEQFVRRQDLWEEYKTIPKEDKPFMKKGTFNDKIGTYFKKGSFVKDKQIYDRSVRVERVKDAFWGYKRKNTDDDDDDDEYEAPQQKITQHEQNDMCGLDEVCSDSDEDA